MLENGSAPDRLRTGMADSLMREISGLLENLASDGATAAIDLRSLPMTEADREELDERLGRGEIAIALDVAGGSEAWETGFTGVWWVRHYGGDGGIAVERIEITPLPEIVAASKDDIAASAARLREALAEAFTEETADG